MHNNIKFQIIDKEKFYVYQYTSNNDIDDIILQLLNEAGAEGFIESRINKRKQRIYYKVEGFTSLDELAVTEITLDQLCGIFKDLCRMMFYLQDSFIETENVLLQSDSVFFDNNTMKLHLIVLPCEATGGSTTQLQQLILKLIDHFSYLDANATECISLLKSKTKTGIHSAGDLNELIDLLTQSMVMPVGQIQPPLQIDDDILSQDTILDLSLDDLSKTDIHQAQQTEDMFAELSPLPDDMMTITTDEFHALHDKIESLEHLLSEEKEKSNHLESELADDQKNVSSLQSELADAQAQIEVLTLENKKANEAQAEREVPAPQVVAAEEMPSIYGFLKRRSTGEIVPITKEKFLIGKMDDVCDYKLEDVHGVSRIHALIVKTEDGDFNVVDCGASNPVIIFRMPDLHQKTLTKWDKQVIHNKDLLMIGSEVFDFTITENE